MQTMMREAAISFPMLGEWSINPSATFEIFGITLYWYGTILAFGCILAVIFCTRTCREFGLSSDNIIDIVLWIIPIGVIGARLYFVAFQWENYKDDLLGIFRVWEGGLAIYGGIIAGAVTAALWSRSKKIPVGAAFDACTRGVMIGQIVGRWCNFINREAFGAQTDIFCRMGLTNPGAETIYVHPTFLYESLWNLLGFVLLTVWVKKGRRKYDGQLFLLYVLWYGIGRTMIEGLRTDSLYLWNTAIRTSQALAALSAVAAAVLLAVLARRPHQRKFADQAVAAPEPQAMPEESNN